MTLDMNQLVNDCMNTIRKTISNMNSLNIAVIGKTGVGKSTLINSIFSEPIADVGVGHPVTTHIHHCVKPGYPISIYDTRGLELDEQSRKESVDEMMDLIQRGRRSGNLNDQIHCIWYCIKADSNRIEQEEVNLIREFTNQASQFNVPVIIVLTQTFSRKASEPFYQYLKNQNLNVASIVRVLAQDYPLDDNCVIHAWGLDMLVKLMTNILPEELQNSFQYAQKASLDAKRKRAHGIVVAAASAAAATGAAPIPFADAAILVPAQFGMISGITAVYGLEIGKSVITAFLSSVVGTAATTVAGKTAVSNLLKMIPGVGTLIGGAISASAAAVLTTSLGEAYIALMDAIYRGELKKDDFQNGNASDFILGQIKQRK